MYVTLLLPPPLIYGGTKRNRLVVRLLNLLKHIGLLVFYHCRISSTVGLMSKPGGKPPPL